MTFYDDMKIALSEAIEIEKGKIPMIEVENMSAETYKPKDISKSLGDWDNIPVVEPGEDEAAAIDEYLSGNPEYQPTISQDEVLRQLGITL